MLSLGMMWRFAQRSPRRSLSKWITYPFELEQARSFENSNTSQRAFFCSYKIIYFQATYQTILFTELVILKSSLVEVYLFLKVLIQSKLTFVAVFHK